MQGILFEKVLHMSLLGCYSLAVVLPIRFFLMKCGRKYAYYLWLIVFCNLCIPVSLYSSLSLIPRQVADFSLEEELGRMQRESSEDGEKVPEDPARIHVLSADGTALAGNESRRQAEEGPEETDGTKTELRNVLLNTEMRTKIQKTAEIVWIMGILVFLIYNLASAARLNRKLSKSSRISWDERERIAETDGIAAPFLWGVLRPVIYLPSRMEEREKHYIVAHETCHRRRKDHIVKLLIYGITILHWFNPFAWLAYSLCCRDMEISCDEEVLARSEKNIRKAYAESLLKYAAKQNGYLMTPLTFGEPSVKTRIQNVLRYKKKGVAISMLAGICVICVAAGLLFRPGDDRAELPAETETSEDDLQGEAEEIRSGETAEEVPDDSGEKEVSVVNNGGEIIQVGGELFYMSGQQLYSNGQKLYTSLPEEDGTWAVYAYELDGSGYEKLMDGRIVGWADDWNTPYVWMTAEDTEGMEGRWAPGLPGLYLLGELNLELVAYTADDFLGVDGQYAYFSRTEEKGVYLDCFWAGDGRIEQNVLGTVLPVQMITQFHAERDYLLFAAGEVRENGEFYGDFYSYNRTPGRLFKEHLTDAGAFAAADGFIYYRKYSRQGEESGGLYRVSYDLTGEELIGEDLSFLTYDESTGTILAAKKVSDTGISNLVRVRPDGSGEQVLLNMEQMLGDRYAEDGSILLGTYLAWEMKEGDKIRYSELNLLDDEISVRAEQQRGQDGPIEEVYFRIKADGSDFWGWDPEQLMQGDEETSYLNEPEPGMPCDPQEAGWNLEQVTDIRSDFAYLSYVPEPGTEDDTYLLGETENYTLYGKGDFQSMLLTRNGRYSEIHYPYASNYMILPDLMEADFDGDGIEEVAVKFNLQHGTGLYIDTLLLGDLWQDGKLYVYQFLADDFTEQMQERISCRYVSNGLQAYVKGEPAGEPMPDDPELGPYVSVATGSRVRFYYGDSRIFIRGGLDFYSGDESRATPEFSDYAIGAESVYENGGKFSLKNSEVQNAVLEDTVRTALEAEYMRLDPDEKDTYIRIDEMRYDLDELKKETVEVQAVVLPVGSESYDYAAVELKKRSDGTGWEVQNIWLEK